MADQNPIKYSDLIAPDDSIEKLIGQLENLTKVYQGVTEEVKTNASIMAQSLKSVSGATEQGRQSTRNASQEADRLSKAYKDLAFARSETARKIAELKAQQQEENRITKLNVQLANSAAGSYNALSAQYSLNKIALNNLTKEERENLPYAKKLEEETKKIYEEMNQLQQATGKYSLNVGNYTQSIEKAIGVNSRWYQGLQQIGGLFAGGFTDGVKAAGTAVSAFGKQLLALLANPIVATIAAITAAFMALAKGISTSEENTMALQRVMAPFQRVLTGVLNILQTAAGWVLKFAEGFEDAAFAVSRFLEKIPLVGKYIKSANDAIQENVDLVKAEQQLMVDRRKNTEKQAQLEQNIAKWRKEAEQTNDPKRRIELLKRAELTQERISLNNIKLEKENVRILEAKARMSQNDKKTNEELTQARVRLTQVETEYYQKTMRLASKKRAIENSLNGGGSSAGGNGSSRDIAKEIQDAQRKQQDAEIALMEEGYDKQRVMAIVQYDRQIEDLQNHLSKEEEIRNAQIATIAAIEQKKWNTLADIADKEMKSALEAEQKDYEKRIKATDELIKQQQKQREEEQKQKEEQEKLDKERGERIRQAMIDDTEFALESLSQLMEGYLRAAEAKRQLADEEVDRAQRTLDAEIEARNQGYAYDVLTAQKEFELAKRNQQKAIEQERRAQQAKEAIDTATQVSSLITATANIWSSFSGMGPWGIPLAIAAIALMWGSFTASKIMAHQAAGSGTEEYGDGTVELLDGGSHQSGNDIDLGRKKDGTRRRAEGGEYFAIINKRNSRRYRDVIPDVINSLNDGTFAEKYMGAYYGSGVNVNVGQAPDMTGISHDVRRIREQGEQKSYTDGKGNTLFQYKNLTRTIRA